MSLLPKDAVQIVLPNATVPFYQYTKDEVVTYQFDSSHTNHPEPMINAMIGLQTLNEGEVLIMINSRSPQGLFPKVENDFIFEVHQLGSDLYQINFTKQSIHTEYIDSYDRVSAG